MLAAGLPTSAAAAEDGPSSSATVGISLSVAPRYELRRTVSASGAAKAGVGEYCVHSNSHLTNRPVTIALLLDAEVEGRSERVTALHPCVNGDPARTPADAAQSGPGLLLVRVE